MKYILGVLLLFISHNLSAQINTKDSSVQVISYWDLGEKQSYDISLQTIKYREADTLSNELLTYTVDVSVVDSTEDSYIIQWRYYNYQTNSSNPILAKFFTAADDITVEIELDELGAIKGVNNWEEVSAYMAKSLDELKTELNSIPGLDKIFEQMESMYSTKESIEASAIQDAQQFHNFHGAAYKLGEILEGEILTPNLYYPEQPFDTKITVSLDEINAEDWNYVVRSSQEVDVDQLTETTFNYLSKLSENMGQTPLKREDMKSVSHKTFTASRIHNTGWVIYSILTKEVESGGMTQIEERIMELK